MATKKTGLVFTGGGLRGICAQAGALVALKEKNLKIDAMIGTSAGGIVGALYASGRTPDEIVARLGQVERDNFLDPLKPAVLLSRIIKGFRGVTGYYQGKALLEWLEDNLGEDHCIEECKIPFYLTMTNISRGEPQVEIKKKGRLAELARASSAVPLVFEPQKIGEEYFVDGGVTDNVPVDELFALHPELDQVLVLTSLNTKVERQSIDNRFLSKSFTPARIVVRVLDAALRAQERDNLRTGEKKKILRLRVRPTDIDLDEPERIGECLEESVTLARQMIARNEVDLSGIARQAS